MPYVSQVGFELPPNSTRIWRYLDFAKYVSLLTTRSLFFARTDKFPDSWDSVLPHQWIEEMRRRPMHHETIPDYTKADWYRDREIPSHPVSCWTIRCRENEGMWKVYTEGSFGVAIQSTVDRLRKCFSAAPEEVRLSIVKYVDHVDVPPRKFVEAYWGTDLRPQQMNPWYVPRFMKREQYYWENELRAMIHVPGHPKPEFGQPVFIGTEGLQTLVKSIHVAPNSASWFLDVVTAISEKYGLENIEVRHSELDEKPPT